MRRRYFYDVYQITILKAEITEGKMKIAMIAVRTHCKNAKAAWNAEKREFNADKKFVYAWSGC